MPDVLYYPNVPPRPIVKHGEITVITDVDIMIAREATRAYTDCAF
jgi:hypothetical protein